MSFLLGLDLGTSSVKCMLIAADGDRRAMAEREYPIVTPQPGWAEQDPEDWWVRTVDAVRAVLREAGVAAADVRAIGLSGQMHGTVLLGAGSCLLRPAIIWADQRSGAQCRQVYARIGAERLAEIAGSGVFPGFMLASLLWVREHEPHVWERLGAVLFPKDYVRLRLMGETTCEVTDASGGLLLDVQRRAWSYELAGGLSIPVRALPSLLESAQVAGYVTAEAAELCGLKPGTPVVAGAADQATGALGSGMVAPGVVAATLGTGGQLVTLATAPRIDRELRIHTFCHALPAQWYLLGATLSAGLSFRWLRDAVLEEAGRDAYPRMTALAEQAPPGAEGLLFMPYLIGERTAGDYAGAGLVPAQGSHQDRPYGGGRPPGGAFVGLTLRHGRAHMARAVMEGVLFSLQRHLDVFEELGAGYSHILATGGGARSPLWRQMMADVFGAPVASLAVPEQSALGAAILAGLGAGVYATPAEACARLVSYGDALEPRAELVDMYRERYAAFNAWYEKMRA